MTKQDIRNQIKEYKAKLSLTDIQSDSETLTKKVLQSESYNYCDTLYCYVSFNQEVRTDIIITNALEQKKKVAIPKVIGSIMQFYYINSLKGLMRSNMGILEPVLGELVTPNKTLNNLMIVPGLAFDYDRNRIGYGKGYYDNYFLQHEDISFHTIALAYDFQIFNKLPVEEHDQKIDWIITPTKAI